MKPRVCIETKCWQGDYKTILHSGYLSEIFNRNLYPFDNRILFINNISPTHWTLIGDLANDRLLDKEIDSFYFVDNYVDSALIRFKLTKESLGCGYVYSSAELVSLITMKEQADFIVHYSSDSILERKYDWITLALELFDKHHDLLVVNPCWNGRYYEAKNESIAEHSTHYLGYGFSDQCYMVKVNSIISADLNCTHPASDRYPRHGGESFEKRVDSFMRTNGLLRATLKDISYIHPSF